MKDLPGMLAIASFLETPFFVPKYREVCERAATWAGFDMVDFASRWLPASIWLPTTMQVWPTR
jgi:hypothetical protein